MTESSSTVSEDVGHVGNVKDDIQSNLRMCGKYCLWGAQTNHINVNYMKYLGH